MDTDLFDWRHFLTGWSWDLLALEEVRHSVPADVIASGWLGYAGATEAELARIEARLGVTLPPSYRAFLAVSNGWRQAGPFLHRLWSTDDIAWFSGRRDLIDAYAHGLRPVAPASPASPSPSPRDAQAARAYLQASLEVSDPATGDDAVYLLNPTVVTPEGEWEACFFLSWRDGADRYPSFQALMQARHAWFRDRYANTML